MKGLNSTCACKSKMYAKFHVLVEAEKVPFKKRKRCKSNVMQYDNDYLHVNVF